MLQNIINRCDCDSFNCDPTTAQLNTLTFLTTPFPSRTPPKIVTFQIFRKTTIMPVQLRSASKLSSDNENKDLSSECSNHENNNNTKKVVTSAQPNVHMTYVVFFGLIIDLLAFTLILPLLPQLLEHYKKHDVEGGLYSFLDSNIKWFGSWLGAPDEFIPVLFGGFIGSLFSFLQFIASPMIGGLSDYYGRRPLLLFCAIGIAISYGVWCKASTFALFVLARVIGKSINILINSPLKGGSLLHFLSPRRHLEILFYNFRWSC